MYLKPEKRTPFGWSFPVSAIIGIGVPPPCLNHVKVELLDYFVLLSSNWKFEGQHPLFENETAVPSRRLLKARVQNIQHMINEGVTRSSRLE